MFSLETGGRGEAFSASLALWASMSCDRRSAQAIPAGPPPTMTTSASICGRSIPSIGRRKWIMAFDWKPASGLRLLDFFGQRRDHIEQVAHHPVIRDLEDGCLHVLIDGH